MRRRLAVIAFVLALPAGEASAANVRVPDLRGMTVARAARTLERAGLESEAGRRLELRRPDTRYPEFVRRAPRRVTGQSVERGSRVPRGTMVAVATVGRPGRQLALLPHHWSQIGFEQGRIVLRGLGRYGDCLNYDHATLGPVTNGVRVITVWARNFGFRKRACERRPRAYVLHPGPDWTAATIGVPQLPETPDPAKTKDQGIVKASAMLEPDGQTIYATFERGSCHAVASASASREGTVATVRVVLGADPDWEGGCTDDAHAVAVLIRLPAPAPPGTTFVSAPCGPPRDSLRCYR